MLVKTTNQSCNSSGKDDENPGTVTGLLLQPKSHCPLVPQFSDQQQVINGDDVQEHTQPLNLLENMHIIHKTQKCCGKPTIFGQSQLKNVDEINFF